MEVSSEAKTLRIELLGDEYVLVKRHDTKGVVVDEVRLDGVEGQKTIICIYYRQQKSRQFSLNRYD